MHVCHAMQVADKVSRRRCHPPGSGFFHLGMVVSEMTGCDLTAPLLVPRLSGVEPEVTSVI